MPDELHRCRILDIADITHDVKRFRLERPAGYDFTPGQATEVSIDHDDWRDEARPFTFTALPDADHLEFVIKAYPAHDGVTEQLHQLNPGDHLLLRDVWGAITYRGPGTFLAGGAGVTPFVAILRHLHATNALPGNTLIFSNKTDRDVILKDEFDRLLGPRAIYTLTDQTPAPGSPFLHGRIDADMLKAQNISFDQPVYVCGPPPMVEELADTLKQLGANPDNVVFEN